MKFHSFLSISVAAAVTILSPFLSSTMLVSAQDSLGTNTIVDIAVANGNFTTLVAAVTEANLADTLSGPGPFTVFAPLDDAFANLPQGLLDTLLADPSGQLTDILLYHVVSGNVTSGDLSDGMTVDTLLTGKSLTIKVFAPGNVTVNGIQVVIADILASNGVIHVISGVLLPPEDDIADIAAGDNRFTTLVSAVHIATHEYRY